MWATVGGKAEITRALAEIFISQLFTGEVEDDERQQMCFLYSRQVAWIGQLRSGQ